LSHWQLLVIVANTYTKNYKKSSQKISALISSTYGWLIRSVKLFITKDYNYSVTASSGQLALDAHFGACCYRVCRAER